MTLNKEGVILSDMKITTKSIKWDTDGAKVKLPQVVTLTVEHQDEIADALDEDGDSVTIYRDDDDYRWVDDEDTYVHVNYRSDRVIGNYHSSKRHCYPIPSDWSRGNNRYLGVELEVEVNKGDREDAAIAINDAVNGGNVGHRLSLEKDRKSTRLNSSHT